jgi:HEPN domain-containing protein
LTAWHNADREASIHEDIARAFLREAKSDLNSAQVLDAAAEYARCIAHAQQTVEKCLKAVLAAGGTVVTGRHHVSPDFVAVCSDHPDVVRIARIAEQLERLGSRSEYPLFGDPNRPIWVPSEQLDQGDAQRALDGALFVFERLSEHRSMHHGVQL